MKTSDRIHLGHKTRNLMLSNGIMQPGKAPGYYDITQHFVIHLESLRKQMREDLALFRAIRNYCPEASKTECDLILTYFVYVLLTPAARERFFKLQPKTYDVDYVMNTLKYEEDNK